MRSFILVASAIAVAASVDMTLRNAEEMPEGIFDKLWEIYGKLKELGTETVCGQTLSELIDLLGLPDTLDSLVATARGWMCN